MERQSLQSEALISSKKSALAAVLTPDEIYQYAIAGQTTADALPFHPFPHAHTADTDGPAKFDYQIRQQLRIRYPSHDQTTRPGLSQSLHQRHMAVMTTILHRSLLDEDFVRAGRALGLILRDEVRGRPTDLRAQGRWGIGAEILIRRDAQLQARQPIFVTPYSGDGYTAGSSRTWFTKNGIEDARKYYQRFIVQYPYVKHAPASVSALDFYPATYGLWIYVVHQQARLRASEVIEDGSSGDESFRHASDMAIDAPFNRQPASVEELLQARQIAESMDSTMSTVPFMEHVELVELRRMVQLWIHDLEQKHPDISVGTQEFIPRADTPLQSLMSDMSNVSL